MVGYTREKIVEIVNKCFNCEVDAISFPNCFPNPNGLDHFCALHNLVYHPNKGTGGFTFWNKTSLEEAEREAKEEEENIKKLRENVQVVGPD